MFSVPPAQFVAVVVAWHCLIFALHQLVGAVMVAASWSLFLDGFDFASPRNQVNMPLTQLLEQPGQ